MTYCDLKLVTVFCDLFVLIHCQYSCELLDLYLSVLLRLCGLEFCQFYSDFVDSHWDNTLCCLHFNSSMVFLSI